MRIAIDIDGTLSTQPKGSLDYRLAKPIPEAIRMVQQYYEDGHYIILVTGRGAMTGRNWKMLTEAQLGQWGVPYMELRFEKKDYDAYIGDEAVSAEMWRQGKWNPEPIPQDEEDEE